ncbi:secreted protein [Histoplasma ohiense]|nr:secreted protein [Histoplasma ohiense (nom. inval.)]
MKAIIILTFVVQVLTAVVSRDPGAGDDASPRSFPLPPLPPATAEEPDPDKVQIIGVTHGGTGCPSNSVRHILSDDRTVMTLIFDKYVASIGPDVPVAESRKNCQLNINLRYPGGFQFSIFSADYRGYANLDRGVKGVQKSTYYFSGQTRQASTMTEWNGPMEKDYLLHDETDHASTVWSPCGANGALNVNSQIRLTSNNRNARGVLTTDSIDASFRQIVHFRWQKCNN